MFEAATALVCTPSTRLFKRLLQRTNVLMETARRIADVEEGDGVCRRIV